MAHDFRRQLQPGAIGNLVEGFARQLNTNIRKFSDEIGDSGDLVDPPT